MFASFVIADSCHCSEGCYENKTKCIKCQQGFQGPYCQEGT